MWIAGSLNRNLRYLWLPLASSLHDFRVLRVLRGQRQVVADQPEIWQSALWVAVAHPTQTIRSSVSNWNPCGVISYVETPMP